MYQMNEKKPGTAAKRPIERERQQKPKDTGGSGTGGKPPRPKRKFHIITKLIVLFLCIVTLIVGMAVGYAYLGHLPLSDVWKKETWQHVFDLIYAP
ncbi:MAG: DNA-directed RNA polymerase subunit beta [Gorillibacterium sp.]|nr:DNA-directed RNA polymerase subunit beta [Gorillibacterium sp.]